MDDLRACPFCGGKAQIKIICKPYRHGWVGCPACRVFINWNQSEAASVAVWNRRVPTEGFVTALTPDAIALLQHMPEAVNRLADRLIDGLEDAVLWGGKKRGED